MLFSVTIYLSESRYRGSDYGKNRQITMVNTGVTIATKRPTGTSNAA